MHWGREAIWTEPTQLVKLMRLSDLCCGRIDFYLEIQSKPMRLDTIHYTMHIAISQELYLQNLSAILFFDFFTDCLFNGDMDINCSAPHIPTTLLIPTILASLSQQELALTIVTKEDDAYTQVVDVFSHELYQKKTRNEMVLTKSLTRFRR